MSERPAENGSIIGAVVFIGVVGWYLWQSWDTKVWPWIEQALASISGSGVSAPNSDFLVGLIVIIVSAVAASLIAVKAVRALFGGDRK